MSLQFRYKICLLKVFTLNLLTILTFKGLISPYFRPKAPVATTQPHKWVESLMPVFLLGSPLPLHLPHPHPHLPPQSLPLHLPPQSREVAQLVAASLEQAAAAAAVAVQEERPPLMEDVQQ